MAHACVCTHAHVHATAYTRKHTHAHPHPHPHARAKIALVTSPGAGDLRTALRHIYGALYAGLALKNPAHDSGAAVRSERFCAELDKYVASLWG